MNQHFKSNGKFLLTGEYLVLKGATALALPLKLGQSLDVETLERDDNRIYWDAFLRTTDYRLRTTDYGEREAGFIEKRWFSVVLNKGDFSIIEADDNDKAGRLSDILAKIKSLNENLFNDSHDYRFNTLLDFDPQWGLGSSSTLINNVSEWAKINPYQLLELTFKGSGYDIACAKAKCPIFYKDKSASIASFNPPFKDNLYFIYLGQKQNSAKEVKAFLDKNKDYSVEIKSISEISRSLPNINNLNDFCQLIDTHENIIGQCLGRQLIKNSFSDFKGSLKSLGAWGGDFILAATEWDYEKVKKYFEDRGLNVIIKYKDIVL